MSSWPPGRPAVRQSDHLFSLFSVRKSSHSVCVLPFRLEKRMHTCEHKSEIKISKVGRKSEQEKEAEYWTSFTGTRKVVRMASFAVCWASAAIGGAASTPLLKCQPPVQCWVSFCPFCFYIYFSMSVPACVCTWGQRTLGVHSLFPGCIFMITLMTLCLAVRAYVILLTPHPHLLAKITE